VGELRLAVVDREGQPRELKVRSGELLMAVLRDQVDVGVGVCGGMLSCGTCLVLLDAAEGARLPPASADETEMLEALGAEPAARLGCQITLGEDLDGLRLTIAPEA
jgi:2Fe-2S ferredoxin